MNPDPGRTPLFLSPPDAALDIDAEPASDDALDDALDADPPVGAAPDDEVEPKRRRREGRGHEYTAAELLRRADYLTRIGRRCEANGRTCIQNAATRRLTVRAVNPATGEPKEGAQPRDVLTCARHMKNWARNRAYEVLNIEQLPLRVSTTGRRSAIVEDLVDDEGPDEDLLVDED